MGMFSIEPLDPAGGRDLDLDLDLDLIDISPWTLVMDELRLVEPDL